MEHFCKSGTFFGGISVACSKIISKFYCFLRFTAFFAVFLDLERNIFHAPQSNTKGGMENPVSEYWQYTAGELPGLDPRRAQAGH